MKRLIDGNDLAAKFRTRKSVCVGDPAAQELWEKAMYDVIETPTMDLNTLRDEVYRDAVEHGLYDYREYDKAHPFGVMYVCRNLALRIKKELCELITATYQQTMEHFTEELADIIILCLSVAGHLGIDVDAAVRGKIEFNKTRPWKHGKEQREDTKGD